MSSTFRHCRCSWKEWLWVAQQELLLEACPPTALPSTTVTCALGTPWDSHCPFFWGGEGKAGGAQECWALIDQWRQLAAATPVTGGAKRVHAATPGLSWLPATALLYRLVTVSLPCWGPTLSTLFLGPGPLPGTNMNSASSSTTTCCGSAGAQSAHSEAGASPASWGVGWDPK